MSATQITLQFLPQRTAAKESKSDLISRSYRDGDAMITIVALGEDDDGRVMVRRGLDGHTWSMPAWLVRLILMESSKRIRAA